MRIIHRNNEDPKKLRTVLFFITFVLASSLLFGQAIYKSSLDYFERCEYSLFTGEPLATRDPVEQVVELRFVGEWVQKDMRLLLPVRYDKPLQVLAGDKENYVGARCVLTQLGPDVTELKGKILFTIFDNEERKIEIVNLDIKGKHLPDDTLITVHSQKADTGETTDDQEKADKEETSGDVPDSSEGTRWNWLVTAEIRDVVVEEGHRVY